MPRKVSSRLGEDGVTELFADEPVPGGQDAEQPLVRAADRLRLQEGFPPLLAMLGIAKEDGEAVRAFSVTLADIRADFLATDRQRAARIRRDEARVSLEWLLSQPEIERRHLNTLDPRAAAALLNEVVSRHLNTARRDDLLTFEVLDRSGGQDLIRDAARAAIVLLGNIRGPDRRPEIGHAVSRLAEIWRARTGQAVTHSSKGQHLAYEPASRSPAGRFVTAAFSLIDPGVPDRKLSAALRREVARSHVGT